MAPQKLVLTIYDHFEMQQVSLPGPSQRNKGGLLVKVPKCAHNSQVLKSLAHVTRRAGPKVGLWRSPQRRVGLSGCDVGRDLIPRQEPDSDPRGVEEQGIYATTAVVEPGAKGTLSTIDSAPGSVNSKKRQPNVCCAAKPHPNKKKCRLRIARRPFASLEITIPPQLWALEVGESTPATCVQRDGVLSLPRPTVAFEKVDFADWVLVHVVCPANSQRQSQRNLWSLVI